MAKFTSLLLYPSSLSLTRYHSQLFPTSPTIRFTYRSHICPPKCQNNWSSLLPSCVYSRSESKKISRKRPKYSTTLHTHMIFYTNHSSFTRSHPLPSEMTSINCCAIMTIVTHAFLYITSVKHVPTHHPPKLIESSIW